MSLDLRECQIFGPALPEPFVKLALEDKLGTRKLLPPAQGKEHQRLQTAWDAYRRKLRRLGDQAGSVRVANMVLAPLVEILGYVRMKRQEEVATREGAEDGGWLMESADGAHKLRVWAVDAATDLDAPSRRGRAYRFSPNRVAQRVLLTKGERAGLLTDGEELRLVLCDPARPESHLAIRLDRSGGWRGAPTVPDSLRLLIALASPAGVAALPELVEEARLTQTAVTKKLRRQAREAIETFLQGLLDHPANRERLARFEKPQELAADLWHEGLILVYRLLFVFKLESSPDPARAFSFASTSLWRNTYSPNVALARVVRRVVDEGAETGRYLEDALRALFQMFAEGLSSIEMKVTPLGGMLFGPGTTPLLDELTWGEAAVAALLDRLLWTPGAGKEERQRVYYGSLDVEDLGRVYESLLELEPGLATEDMCRLRRAKLEVVVPRAQGEPYREDKKGKVVWIEEVPSGRFFLRVGLGRKASGSYYTPHPFVRFLVQETLGPQVEERSPKEDPHPGEILKLKVLDPAMGSGHFLVEACRFLGDALYEACRLCDELAIECDEQAETAVDEAEAARLGGRAAELRRRVEDLPDPDDEMVAYLPSRAPEGEGSGLSQWKSLAIARRLVAVHCLYGVDKNRLAVELAKLSLWLESYAEGLPLTFLDHRLVCGDSLTGPFFEFLLTYPKNAGQLDDLFSQGLTDRLSQVFEEALLHVQDLESSIGKDVADLRHKQEAKERLDAALEPIRQLAAVWSGGVMLGEAACDDEDYQALAKAVAKKSDTKAVFSQRPRLDEMLQNGLAGISFDIFFPEVFYSSDSDMRSGFDCVLGNPPWDKLRFELRELEQTLSPELMVGKERGRIGLGREYAVGERMEVYPRYVRSIASRFLKPAPETKDAQGDLDQYQLFLERMLRCTARGPLQTFVGVLLPGGLMKNPADARYRKKVAEFGGVRFGLHFHNGRRLFEELPQVAEFSALVALGSAPCQMVCAYDQSDYPERVMGLVGGSIFSHDEVLRSLASSGLFPGIRVIPKKSESLLKFFYRSCIEISNDLHRTAAEEAMWTLASVAPELSDARLPSARVHLLAKSMIPCYSSRSIGQHDSLYMGHKGKWHPEVDICVLVTHRFIKKLKARLTYFRMVIRSTCGSPKTNERSVVACLIPPLTATSNSLWAERGPASRANAKPLAVSAVLNSHAVDFLARPLIGANFNKGVMMNIVTPAWCKVRERFLSHAALRLEATSSLFAPLWEEQLGKEWRETSAGFNWPALDGDDERWRVRAAIDAVVAKAYDLTRDNYEHVLSSFSHASYLSAPELCLSMYDELKSLGLEAFTRKHDPYWDIPLNESLPQPVLDLPIPLAEETDSTANEKHQGQISLFTGPSAPANTVRPPLDGTRRGQSAQDLDEETYEILLDLLEHEGVIISSDAQYVTEMDATGVRPFLTRLVDEGHAVVEGQRRGTRYRYTGLAEKPRLAEPTANSPRRGRPAQELDEETYEIILDLLEHEGVITSSDAQYVTEMDAAGVRPYLKRLLDQGHAVQEGQRRGARYRSVKSG